MSKKLLIIVDFQEDFVNGALGFEGAEKLETIIVSKIKEYRANNDDIVYTLDTHDDSYLETMEGKILSVVHCIENTKGWHLYGAVAKEIQKEDLCFTKSTFGSLELAQYLKDKDYEEIELVGLVSNICVTANAVLVKSALPNARIIVDANCTDSFDKSLQTKAFDVLENLHIDVINRRDK